MPSTSALHGNPGASRRIAIIGAGAAGTMAAIFAARAGAEVLLLERTAEGGRKILISGGGRCNILPSRLDETRFITDSSPNTLRKIVRSWPLTEQIRFFDDELGLALVEEVESAKLFPSSNRARDVRDGLIELAARHGTQLLTNTNVSGVLPLEQHRWRVTVVDGEPMDVDAVIVASGGLSVPKTGSDGLGLQVARKLGHTINKTYPALTPITADPNAYTELAGISLPVTLTAHSSERSASATGGFLFTHRGYSGPSVLDVSHVAVRSKSPKTDPAAIAVRWSELDADAWTRALRRPGNRSVRSVLREQLPDRLADVLLYFARVDVARTTAELTREERSALVELLTNGPLPWTGDEGYAKAEVTGGGVSLAEIDPRTMESRLHRNLFLCGELLDAFGPIGGYNFCGRGRQAAPRGSERQMRINDDNEEMYNEEDSEELDEEFSLGDGTADSEATVSCPYCGEAVEITLDPGGGSHQDYVEDCEVCCQPWRVSVQYGLDGDAHVDVSALGE